MPPAAPGFASPPSAGDGATLSAEQQDLPDQYLATNLAKGATARGIALFADAAWEPKRKHFDHTLGSGDLLWTYHSISQSDDLED